MAKIWVVAQDELPPPRSGFDLAIWSTMKLPSETQVRTWAGWSETTILAGDVASRAVLAFQPDLQIWPGTDLAVGSGKIWRFQNHYIAWLDQRDAQIPEIGRALALAGVGLVIARTDEWPSPFLDPLWRVAQSEQIYSLTLGAHPRLYVPCEVDFGEDGVVDLESISGGFEAEFHIGRLAEARRFMSLHRGLRPTLYRAHAWWAE